MTFRTLAIATALLAGAILPSLIGLATLQDRSAAVSAVVPESVEGAAIDLRSLSESDPEAAIALVRKALITDPTILEDAISALDQQRAETASAALSATIRAEHEAIFNSPHNIVLGNPEGTITLVEFFDYNCGYCRRSLADLVTLADNHPELRIVVKEFPVLGADSLAASRVSLAFARQGLDYKAFHLELLGNRQRATEAVALEIAAALGADMDLLVAEMNSQSVNDALREAYDIADKLAINGTPAFIVGDELLMGAVGVDRLLAAVARNADN